MNLSTTPPEQIQQPQKTKNHRRFRWYDFFIPLILTILALFVSIEVGLRIFYRLIPIQVCAADDIIGNYICQPYFVYDKPVRIGYRYQPGFKLEGMWDPANPYLAAAGDETRPTGRSDAFWYSFQTDEMGFPNYEYEWRDQYDIVVLGDSFTLPTAPRRWIETLGEKTGKTTLALGASSWSTLNEEEALKLYGLDKNPEWVLLMFFEGNDIINVAQYLERRDSGLSWKEYDMQNVPLSRRLLTPHLARFFWEKLFPPPQVEPQKYRYPVTVSTEVGEVQTVLKDIHLLPLSADYDTLARSDEFAAVKASILRMNEMVRAQNGRFLLVYIPSKEHVYWSRIWDPVDVNNILERTVTVTLSDGDHGSLQWEPKYLSYETFNANHNALERLMNDFSAENNIEFLNLTPVFWQETIRQGELYHYADPHWNQAGNDLAAEAIYEYMQNH
ncbi:MAG: hypothetical protein D6706_01605 [Chloroflexi bacterium]|nr:MAG: hypothetical protein D6706_01605 [Chloroflexota bacterium]